MDNARELVLEDVMNRLVEERGTEILALDWSILDMLVTERINSDKHTTVITPDKSR